MKAILCAIVLMASFSIASENCCITNKAVDIDGTNCEKSFRKGQISNEQDCKYFGEKEKQCIWICKRWKRNNSTNSTLKNKKELEKKSRSVEEKSNKVRYCILETLNEKNKYEKDYLKQLKKRTNSGKELWNFLLMDRCDIYEGTCPPMRLLNTGRRKNEWSCIYQERMRSSGFVSLNTPISKVDSFILIQESVYGEKKIEENANGWAELKGSFETGFSTNFCREQSINCVSGYGNKDLYPCHMANILYFFEQNPPPEDKNRTLILAMNDHPHTSTLSPDFRDRIHRYFKYIFYEGNDEKIPGIETYPKAFTWRYLYGREKQFYNAIISANIHKKPKLALAAWGKFCTGVDINGISIHGKESKILEKFAKKSSFIDYGEIETKIYFETLKQYKFLIAPRGNGIQSPKFLEAISLLTIPITLNWYAAFRDLKSYGFPIVLVSSWDEITEENLNKWWEEISPTLTKKRWLNTIEAWESLIYGDCWK